VQQPDTAQVPRKRGNVVAQLEDVAAELIALFLVGDERTGRADRKRAGQQLRVSQRVGDAVRADGIFEEARISHERPAGPPALAHESALAGEGMQLHRLRREVGRQIRERSDQQPTVSSLDAGAERLVERASRHGNEHTGFAVVRLNGPSGRPLRPVPVIAVVLDAFPVAVHAACGVAALTVRARLYQSRHRRPNAVGADDVTCRHRLPLSVLIDDHDTGDSAGMRARHIHHSSAVHDVGAGLGGGVGQHPIQHVASRRIERLDTVARRNRNRDRLDPIVKSRLPHRRRRGGDHGRQDAPAVQLQHSPPHQRMRRQGVAASLAPIDDQDPETHASQEQCSGGAGAACPGNHDVVAGGGLPDGHVSLVC